VADSISKRHQLLGIQQEILILAPWGDHIQSTTSQLLHIARAEEPPSALAREGIDESLMSLRLVAPLAAQILGIHESTGEPPLISSDLGIEHQCVLLGYRRAAAWLPAIASIRSAVDLASQGSEVVFCFLGQP
jgi:hypothetical protein